MSRFLPGSADGCVGIDGGAEEDAAADADKAPLSADEAAVRFAIEELLTPMILATADGSVELTSADTIRLDEAGG